MEVGRGVYVQTIRGRQEIGRLFSNLMALRSLRSTQKSPLASCSLEEVVTTHDRTR